MRIKVTGVGSKTSLASFLLLSHRTGPSILVLHLYLCVRPRWGGETGGALSVVGRGGDVAAVARPVGVDKMAGVGQQLVRVGSKVVPLRLKKNT